MAAINFASAKPLGFGLNFARAGGGGTVSLPAGYAVEVKSTGDRLAVTFPDWTVAAAYSLTPNATAKVTMLVTSKGYTGTTLGDKTRTVVATVVARKPYPDEAEQQETADGTDVTTDLWLSEPIYSGDTIVLTVLTGWATDTNGGAEAAETWTSVGITNNSTLTYAEARPVADWNDVPVARYWDPSTGDFDVSICAFHGHASAGEQVAAVVFTFSDGVNTATKTVTAATLSSLYDNETSQGTRVVEYKATFAAADVSSLDDGDCTVDFDVYPLIGDATAIRTASDDVNDVTTMKVRLDEAGNQPPRYAVVNGTGSNAGTPATHATEAAALADTSNTYGTVALAKAGLASYYNANGGDNSPANGVMILPNSGSPYDVSTMMGSPGADSVASDVWCTLKAQTAGSVTITDTASVFSRPQTAYWKFQGLNITGDGASDIALFRFTNGESEVWLDDVTVSDTNNYAFVFYQPSVVYATNSTFTETTLYLEGATGRHCRLLRGCSLTTCRIETVKTVLGCALVESHIRDPQTNAPDQSGLIFAFNHSEIDDTAGRPAVQIGLAHNTTDVAVVQNVFWNSDPTPLTVLVHFARGYTAKNFVIFHNTSHGQRLNKFYNDAGSTSHLMTLIFEKFNNWYESNIKTDTYPPADGNRVGNWWSVNGVANKGNAYIGGAEDSGFEQDFLGIGTVSGVSGGTALSVTYTDAANGDFTISSAGDIDNLVPSTEHVLAFDLAGSARESDGTGCAGAYED